MTEDIYGQYNTRSSSAESLRSVNLRLAQGKMYAVVGVHMASKESLLRLIGKVTSPTGGDILVPSHLKVVHVEKDAQLMRHLSLYENLMLGCRFAPVDVERLLPLVQVVPLGRLSVRGVGRNATTAQWIAPVAQ